MIEAMHNKPKSSTAVANLIITVLVLGSIWGLSETVLGGGLRAVNFPYRAGLLTGIGMAIMGIGLAAYKNPAPLFGIGLITVLVKLLAVPILHCSVACKANSCIAVLIQTASLALVALPLRSNMAKSVHARMAAGALAALIASVSFYFVGMRVAPCQYLLSFTPGKFVVTEGLVWAAFSAVLLPLGYLAGEKLTAATPAISASLPVYYAASALVVLLCWGLSALAIAAGI